MTRPQLVVLAGPNGAGKSTFHEAHLRDSPLPFLNADLLSARTGIDSPEAARLLDAARDEMIESGVGFITETVFSDPFGVKVSMLRRAVARGFEVTLLYVGVESPGLAGLRIDQRVAAGGHDVPRDRLVGRFARSLSNLRDALEFVPFVKLYDNSSVEEPFRLIASFEAGTPVFVDIGRTPAWARGIVARLARRRRPGRGRGRRRRPCRPRLGHALGAVVGPSDGRREGADATASTHAPGSHRVGGLGRGKIPFTPSI